MREQSSLRVQRARERTVCAIVYHTTRLNCWCTQVVVTLLIISALTKPTRESFTRYFDAWAKAGSQGLISGLLKAYITTKVLAPVDDAEYADYIVLRVVKLKPPTAQRDWYWVGTLNVWSPIGDPWAERTQAQ